MIALGTVQFGMNYGATNFVDHPDTNEVRQILELAHQNDIRLIDTAADYGASERVLGSCHVSRFDVMTKLPSKLPDCMDVRRWIRHSVEASMSNLAISRLHSIFVHRSEQILNEVTGLELLGTLKRLKDEGIVDRIGVSVYDPAELACVMDVFIPDVVQLPVNVFDVRFVESGYIDKLKNLGVLVVGRSTFLQGLLLNPMHKVTNLDKLSAIKLESWHRWICDNGLDCVAECIGFCHECGVDQILVGVNSYTELQNILERKHEPTRGGFKCINDPSPLLIDPRKWVLAL